ncbi:glycine dehydrogenase (decarboxylating), mitochondrial-like [Watersipora subatra]|uniref:glycine dehydrogenase (decarboxylating), mitochondrial-like n=1 Tax=Watersipora subatra TaxID=2589382 RepID=UPI00355B1AF8
MLKSRIICNISWRHDLSQKTNKLVRGISTTRVCQKLRKREPIEHGPGPINIDRLLKTHNSYLRRHIGPSTQDLREMLRAVAAADMESLISAAVPANIRLEPGVGELGQGLDEAEMYKHMKELASLNEVWRSYIGMGYYNCNVPPVIQRNVLENPGWITQYTPYQAEIAQGRLFALMVFQTMVSDLTGLELANASLLDESTSAAEAMGMCYRLNKRTKFLIDSKCHPQTISVVETRAKGLGITTQVIDRDEADFSNEDISGILLQYPDTNGTLYNMRNIVHQAHQHKTMVACASDLLALTLVTPPGELGCDIVVGSAQRFGIPLGYGGPHAGFFSTRKTYARSLPGRVVGLTKDAQGNPAYRLALQTREQHIRRDKATSNICTAQALLANMSALFAVWHGPKGLKNTASIVHNASLILHHGLTKAGNEQHNSYFFDTLLITPALPVEEVKSRAEGKKINLRYLPDGKIGVSLDETVTEGDLDDLLYVFGSTQTAAEVVTEKGRKLWDNSIINTEFERITRFLEHKIFHSYHSETDMVRLMKQLENRDLSLCHSMIPLGSCTMKLNGTTTLLPVTFAEFNNIHPFVPREQVKGYMKMFEEFEQQLCDLTGYDNCSLQPNSGAQGEYAGLRCIMHYLASIGQGHRNVCLIPESAHGTNFASAQMANMKISPVKISKNGGIDMIMFEKLVDKLGDQLAAIMVTYPSTNGLFDKEIRRLCEVVHAAGGQVYLDGANMNAQVGICRPGDYGSDVSHLNLHKTFCIPHGGGGPGMGPIVVKSHLAPFLPTHPVVDIPGPTESFGTVSAAPFGSSSILPISYTYLKMSGREIRHCSEVAILNANYMARKLNPYYKIMFTNENGYNAHEFIIDFAEYKEKCGVDSIDAAKRLQDFGFHSPTVSWPVSNTLMIEPTESESRAEMDRFCDALIAIRQEIQDIIEGKQEKDDNTIKNAPHTMAVVTDSMWNHPYSREQAAFPARFVRPDNKFWPTVGRINDVYGDTNLVCKLTTIDHIPGTSVKPPTPLHFTEYITKYE